MKVYRVKPGTSPQITGALVFRVLLQTVVLGLILGWSAYRFRHLPDSNRLYLGLGVFLGIALVISVAIHWYRAKAALESYTLVITGDRIRREIRHFPVLEISANQIQQVRRAVNRTLTIRTTQGMMNELYVPFQVEGIEEIEAWLSQFAAIEDQPPGTLAKSLIALSPFAMVVLMGVVIFSSNLILVAVCGPLMLGLGIWSAVQIQRSRNVDKMSKVIGYMVYFVLVCMAVMIYGKVRSLFM